MNAPKKKDPALAFSRIPEKTVALVNGIHSYIFLVLLLCLFFLRFQVNGNEEHYLALAKLYMDPNWLAASFSLEEPASTRIFYQYLVGFFLQYVSFETVTGVGRLILCLAIAYPLYKLYQWAKLSNADILLHLPLLYFYQENRDTQSFFALEWIFLSVEPKVFAYVFVLLGLYFLLKEKYYAAALLLAIGSYFHVLVGALTMAYFCLYHLVWERSLKKTIWLGLFYSLCLIPLLWLLSATLSNNLLAAHAEYPVNLDWIYTYFRQPFHTAIFYSGSYFVKTHLDGVALATVFFLLCVFVFNRWKDPRNQKINRLNILIFAGLFLSVILAFFDKNGSFVKYFPFRINALYCFLAYLQAILFVKFFVARKETLVYLQFAILLLFFATNVPKVGFHFLTENYRYATGQLETPAYREMTDFIRRETPRESVLLFLSRNSLPDDLTTYDVKRSIIRKTERDRLVAFNFAPVSPGSPKIYEWYQRLQLKKKLIEDYRNLCQVRETYPVDYALTDFSLPPSDCYEKTYQNDDYYLYHLR